VASPTTSPDAVVRTDLLPGVTLTVEEVGPGILRVLDDAAGHELEAPLAGVHAVNGTGDVWVEQGGVSGLTVRLGGQESYLTREGMQAAPDGTFWWMSVPFSGTPVLYHLVGDDVVEQPLPDVEVPDDDSGRDNYSTFDITPDGRGWIAIDRGRQEPLEAVLEDGDWTVLPALGSAWTRGRNAKDLPGGHDFSGMAVTPNGAVWLVDAGAPLMRYAGGEWRYIDPRRFGGRAEFLAAGSDGTLWVKGGDALARHDERDWKVWDDVMAWDCAAAYCEEQTVGNDGTLWLRFHGHIGGATKQLVKRGIIPEPAPYAPKCDSGRSPDIEGASPGVLSFDGKRWRQYLAGHCVSDIAVADDSSIWVVDAGGEVNAAGAGLYVITPEAVAATV
jgi:hypothetical protein